jgi:hypothetical protein
VSALFRDVIRYRFIHGGPLRTECKGTIVSKDNLLLASLWSDNRESLMSRCTPVELPLKTLLYAAQEIPRYAYFMTPQL